MAILLDAIREKSPSIAGRLRGRLGRRALSRPAIEGLLGY